MDQSADYMRINFDYFEIQIWMLQIVRAEKTDEKKCGYFPSFYVSFLNYGPYIVQKSLFFTILCWAQQET